ncbi:MAG: methylated-DNA-[protein]-cysteine S-methyltransferase [Actinomycetota bacterium]|jgi:methylated-DNA-[protein]-cysteine S-methyltransferase|nr:methylated-DNA-[protein]-cysteine S-methyltransferase [Actinomycetota bacterium]
MTDIEHPLRDVSYAVTDTPVGTLVLAASDAGLLACSYDDEAAVLDRLARQVSRRVLRHPAPLDAVRRELDAYFDGDASGFTTPVDLALATPFTREVLGALGSVPYGATTTYGQMAVALGRPRAARAVGNALGANPLCVVLPCHRVLPAGSGVGGYAGGPAAKRLLLDLERGTGALLAAATTAEGVRQHL